MPLLNKKKGGTMKPRFSRIAVVFLVVISLTALLFSACAAPKPAEVEQLTVWHSLASVVPWIVADREGFFAEQGLNVDVRPTQEDEPPFLAGKTPISETSSWEVAEYRLEGEDVVLYGTAGCIRFFNGIAIRPGDTGKYKSVQDMLGKKLGNPGFGTGTWRAFVGLAKYVWGIEAEKDFENVTASPGALLGLLDKGEIEGALLFSGQTMAAVATGLPLVFRFDEAWEEKTGQPLLITSNVARASWLKENLDVARRLQAALDKAIAWMAQYPEQFSIGGRYEMQAGDSGWLKTEESAQLMQKWLKEGLYYTTSDLYTQAWVDSAHDFNVVVYGQDAPPKGEVFWSPAELKSK